MTRNAGRGRQSSSPLKHAILEVFRRRTFRRPNSLRKRAISAGKRRFTGGDFSSSTSEYERMPSHHTDKQSHAQKTVIERRKKRKQKSRSREKVTRGQRKTLGVTEVVRRAEEMSKSECKNTNKSERDGASFAIIAKTRLTQQVGIIEKAKKSQMIHKGGNEQPHNVSSEQSLAKAHCNGYANEITTDATVDGLSPARPSSGRENCRQPSLSDVAARLVSSLQPKRPEGIAYIDQLKSELNMMMCERTCMTPQLRRSSQSPSLQSHKPSCSQQFVPKQVDDVQQTTECNAVADETVKNPVKAMDVNKRYDHDVLPEERGKSELARLFGEFESKSTREDTKPAACQPQCEETRLPLSQSDVRHPSCLSVARNEIFPCSSALVDGAFPSGHIADLLDMLDDPRMWSTASSSACDVFDYDLGSAASAWSLSNVKPISLGADSPSPVKLYPRRLY